MNADILSLIRTIGTPDFKDKDEAIESDKLYKLAYRNKVPLLYLDSLKERNKLDKLNNEYEKNLIRYSILFDDVKRLTPSIDGSGIKYALIKTFRYYPENPNDIDILVFGNYSEKLDELNNNLNSIGYLNYTVGNNIYNLHKIGKIGYWDYKRPKDNLRSGEQFRYFDLDFYFEIMVEQFVHGNRNIFAPYTVQKKFQNKFSDETIEANVLTPGAELFYLFFHSIFPTRTIGLELFFSSIYIIKEFIQDDYQVFGRLTKKSYLTKEVILCITHLRNIYRQAFGEEYDKFEMLFERFGKRSKIIIDEKADYPYTFDILFFLKAGLKSALHKKGLQSLSFVLIKCINPKYSYNILRELFSKRLAQNRYALKFFSK